MTNANKPFYDATKNQTLAIPSVTNAPTTKFLTIDEDQLNHAAILLPEAMRRDISDFEATVAYLKNRSLFFNRDLDLAANDFQKKVYAHGYLLLWAIEENRYTFGFYQMDHGDVLKPHSGWRKQSFLTFTVQYVAGDPRTGSNYLGLMVNNLQNTAFLLSDTIQVQATQDMTRDTLFEPPPTAETPAFHWELPFDQFGLPFFDSSRTVPPVIANIKADALGPLTLQQYVDFITAITRAHETLHQWFVYYGEEKCCPHFYLSDHRTEFASYLGTLAVSREPYWLLVQLRSFLTPNKDVPSYLQDVASSIFRAVTSQLIDADMNPFEARHQELAALVDKTSWTPDDAARMLTLLYDPLHKAQVRLAARAAYEEEIAVFPEDVSPLAGLLTDHPNVFLSLAEAKKEHSSHALGLYGSTGWSGFSAMINAIIGRSKTRHPAKVDDHRVGTPASLLGLLAVKWGLPPQWVSVLSVAGFFVEVAAMLWAKHDLAFSSIFIAGNGLALWHVWLYNRLDPEGLPVSVLSNIAPFLFFNLYAFSGLPLLTPVHGPLTVFAVLIQAWYDAVQIPSLVRIYRQRKADALALTPTYGVDRTITLYRRFVKRLHEDASVVSRVAYSFNNEASVAIRAMYFEHLLPNQKPLLGAALTEFGKRSLGKYLADHETVTRYFKKHYRPSLELHLDPPADGPLSIDDAFIRESLFKEGSSDPKIKAFAIGAKDGGLLGLIDVLINGQVSGPTAFGKNKGILSNLTEDHIGPKASLYVVIPNNDAIDARSEIHHLAYLVPNDEQKEYVLNALKQAAQQGMITGDIQERAAAKVKTYSAFINERHDQRPLYYFNFKPTERGRAPSSSS